MTEENTPSSSSENGCKWQGLMWWTTLVMSVIALPLFAGIIALGVTKSPVLQMLIFMISCWLATWLGMWLMKRSGQ